MVIKHLRFPRFLRFSSSRLSRSLRLQVVLAILIIFIPVVALSLYFGGRKAQAAWSPTMTEYTKRKMLNVVNNSGDSLASTTTIAITVDTKALYDAKTLQSDCDDLRVVYQPNDTTHTELSRYLVYSSGQSCSTSTATKVYFSLQSDLANSGTATTYYIYYGNNDATTPANTDNAFDIGAADALLVCPFEGSTTCAAGETPSTESGAIRYSGSKSALSFDGINDSTGNGTTSTVEISTSDSFTIEAWLYIREEPKQTGEAGIAVFGYNSWLNQIAFGYDNSERFFLENDVCCGQANSNTSAFSYNQWNHVAVTRESSGATTFYVNGVQKGTGTHSALSNNKTVWQLGYKGGEYFPGMIDEFRLSNTIRYTSNFTPSTTPFVRDEYTKLLLHFDENGDDPRNTGKAIDDSGNANHGTITGAKYVSGLIGQDSSSSDSGYIARQSYAGHGGIFVEEATTNKITNPSFEHGTYNTNWDSVGGNLTASQNTTAPYYKFGSNSLKLIASASAISGSSNMDTITIDPDSTAAHMLSFYAYDGTTGNVGGTVSSSIVKPVWEGVAQAGGTYTDMGGGWWRVTYSTITTDSANEYGVEAQVSKTIYVDGVQLEEKAYATTYADGSLGTGYAWTGTAHESTSTRTAEDLQYSATNNVQSSAGSISFWIKPATNSSSANLGVFGTTNGDGNAIRYISAGGYYQLIQGGVIVVSPLYASFTNGNWYHIVQTWSGTSGQLYVNNATGTVTATSAFQTPTGIYFGYGTKSNTTYSDFRIYSTALTSAQVADLYYAGLVSHQETAQTTTVDRFSADKGQNPTAVWHMDEGYGTQVGDATTYLNHLTLSGATWTINNASSRGAKGDVAISFDGSNDYLSRSFDQDFDFGTNTFTISGLFKHPSTISGTDTILARQSGSTGYKVYMNSSGYICFSVNSDSACTTTSYADSKWHSFSAVRDTTTLTLYIDAVQKSQATGLTATTVNGSNTLYLGIDSDGTSNPWTGFIDELTIYPYTRSAAQTKIDNLGQQISVSIGSQIRDNLTDGLVGWWKMDETSWSGVSNEVLDSSGNANHGTSANGATTASGKFGNGGSFDGSGAYISGSNMSAYSSNNYTVALWIKPDTLATEFPVILNNNSWSGIVIHAATNGTLYAGTNAHLRITTSAGYITTGSWIHIVLILDSTKGHSLYKNGVLTHSNTNVTGSTWGATNIGGNTSNTYFDGAMDDIRIYKRVLSAVEVRQLYDWAPGPVVHLKMDEGSGVSANDDSGNNRTGTLNDGATWSTGKFGKGIKLDGTNDDVSMPDFGY